MRLCSATHAFLWFLCNPNKSMKPQDESQGHEQRVSLLQIESTSYSFRETQKSNVKKACSLFRGISEIGIGAEEWVEQILQTAKIRIMGNIQSN